MKKKKKPEKLHNLLSKIKECIKEGNYIIVRHALERQLERKITTLSILHVLKNGNEEKNKTHFDIARNTWKYAIRGKTLNAEDIRIIICFDEDGMIIITVINVGVNYD